MPDKVGHHAFIIAADRSAGLGILADDSMALRVEAE
jgi:hypothetical protein